MRTVLTCLLLTASLAGQAVRDPFPVKREENASTWDRDGWNAIFRAKAEKPNTRRAKNVILFIGDGMGVSTLTAARILEGQLRGESGEENRLSFEQFPYSAFSKTYSANQQTSDSAPTMSAIISGKSSTSIRTFAGLAASRSKEVWKLHDDTQTRFRLFIDIWKFGDLEMWKSEI